MAQIMPETRPDLSIELPVFVSGKYQTTSDSIPTSDSKLPKPLVIFRPTQKGTYPVILFFPGFLLQDNFYSDLLNHIASHGFIIVATETYNTILPPSQTKEIDIAAKVANWLQSGLPPVLRAETIEPNLGKVTVVGHSRGGKTAFALALGLAKIKITQTFSALVGIDPVAGRSGAETDPKVLSDKPGSFDFTIPVTVIGTGLGSKSKWGILPPCAPEKFGHKVFFKDCKSPRAHFDAKDYGHMDVLNDHPPGPIGKFIDMLCVNGKGSRDYMRRSVGGITVAFLNYYFEGNKVDFETIVNQPEVAPAKLDQVQFNPN